MSKISDTTYVELTKYIVADVRQIAWQEHAMNTS
jgi:hypothetical protein